MNNEVLNAMKTRGLDTDEFVALFAAQEERKLAMIKSSPGAALGDAANIRDLALVLRQTLLHRAVELARAAVLSLVQENGYALALSVRAHFETTAVLGFLHHRLSSLQAGNISAEAMHHDLLVQLLGSRDKDILATQGAEPFAAKQILSMLENADKAVSKHILGGTSKQHALLKSSYEWLCEFCHPNFHSNKLAFRLNREQSSFEFRHGSPLDNVEANIVNYLLISGPVFVHLYDELGVLVAGGKAATS